jgi:hypothetical protein
MKYNLNHYIGKFNKIFRTADGNKNWENSFFTIFCGLMMGLWITSFVIWHRLIRERLPREVIGEVSSYTYWIVLYAFIICFFQLLYKLNELRKEFKGLPSTKAQLLPYVIDFLKAHTNLFKILEFFSLYFVSGPLFLWRFIYLNVLSLKIKTDLTKYCYNFGLFLWTKCFFEKSNYHLRVVLTIYVLILLPRIIAISLFLYEIVINQKLDMFYRIGPILFIPVIFFSLKQIIMDICDYECERLQTKYLTLSNVIKDKMGDVQHCDIIIRCECVSDEGFDWAVNYHTNLQDVKETMRVFERVYKATFVFPLLINIMLTLSFLIWLLIILNIY